MNILYLYSDTVPEWNCSEHRIAVPFRAMRRKGVHCELAQLQAWENNPFENDPLTEKADLIIIQRNVFVPTVSKIAYWKAKGKAIVIDFDDAYHLMGKDTGSPSSDFWLYGMITEGAVKKVSYPHPLRCLEYGAKIAGAVSGPSELLLEDWSKFGVRTYFLPNFIEPRLYKRHVVHKEPNTIYIGGGGSMGHLKSWVDSGIVQALNQLIMEDKRIVVALTGDDRVFAKLTPLSPSHKVTMHWETYARYSKNLSQFDIGVLPLCGPYDDRRSWIKPMEYSSMGIPWIGSNRPPNVVPVGTGVLVENTIEDWYKAFRNMVDNLDEITRKSRSLAPSIMDYYDIDNNADLLYNTYERIIEENAQ
jgi:glycosyltransferase involved in cell wall biosynthesis